jgi:hypothetical protein
MDIQGQVKVIFDTKQVSDRFKSREIVIITEANTPYPQHVSFQLTQDKCAIADQYKVGDEVKAQFNLRGREWNSPHGTKYFNTLEIWRIERVGQGSNTPAASQDNNDSLSF